MFDCLPDFAATIFVEDEVAAAATIVNENHERASLRCCYFASEMPPIAPMVGVAVAHDSSLPLPDVMKREGLRVGRRRP